MKFATSTWPVTVAYAAASVSEWVESHVSSALKSAADPSSATVTEEPYGKPMMSTCSGSTPYTRSR